LLVIIALLAFFWYVLVPFTGAFFSRHKWRAFRERFNTLCRKPFLDYGTLRNFTGGEFYFTGGFETITEGNILWIKNDNLTVPVLLKKAQSYMLPLTEKRQRENTAEAKRPGDMGDFDINAAAPGRLNWNSISTLTADVKVFIGGSLTMVNGRPAFASAKGHPLLIIFYECSDRTLNAGVLRAGRYRNEYWNVVTPYSLICGLFSLAYIAFLYQGRPLYRITVLSAIVAIFSPLFPLLPPGLVFSVVHRRVWWQACIYRVYHDIALLPMQYVNKLNKRIKYICRIFDQLPPSLKLPRLIPADKPEKNEAWHIFGVVDDENDENELPKEPHLPFTPYGILPGNPERISRLYGMKALVFEILSWILLVVALAVNIFFTALIIIFFI